MVFDLLGSLPAFEDDGRPMCSDPSADLAEQTQLAELFFPVSESNADRVAAAKALCGRCPVQRKCLQIALEAGEVGIWGGTTTEERRAVRLLGREGRAEASGEVAA
jgi:WhiB family redox-sensing transcriptional regulator